MDKLIIRKCGDLKWCDFRGKTNGTNGCSYRTEHGFCYAYCGKGKLDDFDIYHLSEEIYRLEEGLGVGKTIIPCWYDNENICKKFETDWRPEVNWCRHAIVVGTQVLCAVKYGPRSMILYPDALDRYAYLKELEAKQNG